MVSGVRLTRQTTVKAISIYRIFSLCFTQKSKLVNAFTHSRHHVVKGRPQHIRYISNGVICSSFCEALAQQTPIDMRSERQSLYLSSGHECTKSSIQLIWSRSTHCLQGSQTGSIHHLLANIFCNILCRSRNQLAQATYALDDSFAHQFLRFVGSNQVLDACSTCTLSENHDVIWVTTKLSDIVAYPLQGCYLVPSAIVA